MDSSAIVSRAVLFGSLLWSVQIFILLIAADSDCSVRHTNSSALQQWVGWGIVLWTAPNVGNSL